jgi:hypothetical protein
MACAPMLLTRVCPLLPQAKAGAAHAKTPAAKSVAMRNFMRGDSAR